jgi:hypothetical protein
MQKVDHLSSCLASCYICFVSAEKAKVVKVWSLDHRSKAIVAGKDLAEITLKGYIAMFL